MKLWDRRRNIQAARSSALGRKPREDWKAVRMFTAPFFAANPLTYFGRETAGAAVPP